MSSFLRLKPRYQPEIMMGGSHVTPCNMQGGSDRATYLVGLLAFLNDWRVRHPDADAARMLETIPMASELVDVTPIGFVEKPDVLDRIAFRPERLAVALLDGADRRRAAVFQAGVDTPAVATAFSLLTQGVTREQLAARFEDLDVDVIALVETLVRDGMVEELDENPSRVADAFRERSGDRLTWIGHAGFVLQSGSSTVWVDPWLWPRVTWRDDERNELFSPDHGDSLLFDGYGPEVTNLTAQELPAPDVVLITHQDIDHVRSGVLMALPEHTLIVVPKSSGAPWDVDLRQWLLRVLGDTRRIVALGHGESLVVGTSTVTAFPFRGEFPNALPHQWNCYLVQTASNALAFTADARLAEPELELLVAAAGATNLPLTLLAQPPEPCEIAPGYRDAPDQPYNLTRLWAWYVPVGELFAPSRQTCLTYPMLANLQERANLAFVFPCAKGCCPWFRFALDDLFYVGIGHLSRADISTFGDELGKLGLAIPPIKYGVPWQLDRAHR